MHEGRKIGQVEFENGGAHGELGPDGKYLILDAASAPKAPVFEIGVGPISSSFTVGYGTEARFAGPDRLIVSYKGSGLSVCKISTGEILGSTIAGGDGSVSSVSPGGRLAAIIGNRRLRDEDAVKLYRLDDCLMTGALPLGAKYSPMGGGKRPAAFSPDGREIAGVFRFKDRPGKEVLVGWDLKTGRRVFFHEFSDAVRLDAAFDNESPDVQWFPDGKRLFLFGRCVFDRAVGGPVWTLGNTTPDGEISGRETKVIAEDRIAAAVGDVDRLTLRTIPLPLDEIEKGTKAFSTKDQR
ncbi:MAG: hypothetical protein ACRC1K_16160 [Planctomycetia bacterium]